MSILNSGLNLMLYGMGTVFIFLSILIITTMMMSLFISKFFGAPEANSASLSNQVTSSTPDRIEPTVIKVLQAAVDAHRK